MEPPHLAPRVPGHAPALPLPHLETIAIRVRDTETRAQASGFRDGKAGSGDRADRWPAPTQLPPPSPPPRSTLPGKKDVRRRGQRPSHPAGSVPCPIPPAQVSPRWPPTLRAPPGRAHVARKCDTAGFVFWASLPPRRPLSPEARSPRPCPGPWSGKSPGRGAGGAGHTKGPLWSGSKHSPGRGAVPALWLGEGRGAQARAPVLRLGAGPTHLARQVQPQAPCRSLLLPPHLLEMKGEVGRESGLRWPQEGGQIELLWSCVLPFPHPVAL